MIDCDLEKMNIESSKSSIDAQVASGSDATLAVKIIRTDDEELVEIAYNEYKLLRSIDHQSIVKMHDAFFNKTKQTMYLVMDLVKG